MGRRIKEWSIGLGSSKLETFEPKAFDDTKP